MNLLQEILSLVMAGSMLLTGALETAAPQHNIHGTLFLVNRQYTLSENYEPEDLVLANVPGQVKQMRADAAAALEEMYAACKAEIGVTLVSVSGYRSWSRQNNIYQRKLRAVKKDEAKAQEYVAPPGASEHQLGLAMDIGQRNKNNLDIAFAKTKGGAWVKENCWRFGFILRYGEDWEDVTGYKYEPWHFRYVGKEWSQQIHEANIPFETWMISHRVEVLEKLLKGDKQE